MHREPLPPEPITVEAISGAFMLVRRGAIRRVGALDEGYFLHFEDLDWCRRFRDSGFSILFVPNVEVIHHKGTGSRGRPVWVEWHKHRGMLRYFRKFHRKDHFVLTNLLVRIGVWGRFGLLATLITVRRLLN
jgi:GT2 family glycosyltransferase